MLNSTKINKPKEQARITQIVLNTRGLNYGTPLATPQASEPLRHSTQYLKHPTLPLSIFKPNTSMYITYSLCVTICGTEQLGNTGQGCYRNPFVTPPKKI